MDLVLLISYTFGLVMLAGFSVHAAVMLALYHRLRPVDPPTPPLDDRDLPRVTVQLPLYNERHVARRLLDAVCRLDYPRELLHVQLLDDSTDDTTSILDERVAALRADGFDIEHVRRPMRNGFKAGALRHGLETAVGEFVAIFDADFVPHADFLRRTIPHLVAEPRLGMVQTRWEHLNADYSLLTRVQAMALDAHFAMEQQVRNRARCFINFNGTAGVWRKSCIIDAGNWHSDTLTEDLDISYRAQLRGWRFLYLNDVAVPAELPAEINGLKLQQFRWTKGAVETARKLLWSVWRSHQPLRIKLYATSHLTSNLVFPFVLFVAVLSVPMVLLKSTTSDHAVWFDCLGAFVVATMSTMLFYLTAQRDLRVNWRRRMLLYPLFLAASTGLAINNSRAVIEALVRRKSAFVRTPKYNIIATADGWGGSTYRIRSVGVGTILEILLALYFIAGVAISIDRGEYAAIPFQLLFLVGFGATGFLSVKHAR